MRGKRAKWLADYARKLLASEDIDINDGYNHYNQLANYKRLEPAYSDGWRHNFEFEAANWRHPRYRAPDGTPLSGMFNAPGTIQTAWKFRLVYQNLKRLWKETKGEHNVFKLFYKKGGKGALKVVQKKRGNPGTG